MGRLQSYLKQLAATALIIGVSLLPAFPVSGAGTAKLNLLPSDNTITKGQVWSVQLRVDLSEPANSVQVFIRYDNSKLQFLSIDGSESSFENTVQTSSGGGTIEVSRFSSNGPISGQDKKIAKITFKGLADAGSSTLSFGENTLIPSADGQSNQWNADTTGGTFTHKPAEKNSISENMNEGQADMGNMVDDPVAVASLSGTERKTFRVAVIVKDRANAGIKDAEVTIDGQQAKTDETGVASFIEVTAGTHTIIVKAGDYEETREVVLEEERDASEVQQFVFQDTSQRSKTSFRKILMITLGSLLAICIGGFMLWRIRKNKVKSPTDRTDN